mmetsp:Transcript_2697/g.2762  ORF Transcript_2697/g.2762 Transcript_2697/m.2762 type:complete len:196 (+) Transcript_2697:10-597(+)
MKIAAIITLVFACIIQLTDQRKSSGKPTLTFSDKKLLFARMLESKQKMPIDILYFKYEKERDEKVFDKVKDSPITEAYFNHTPKHASIFVKLENGTLLKFHRLVTKIKIEIVSTKYFNKVTNKGKTMKRFKKKGEVTQLTVEGEVSASDIEDFIHTQTHEWYELGTVDCYSFSKDVCQLITPKGYDCDFREYLTS